MARIAICVVIIFFAFSSCTKINFIEYHKNPGQLRFCNISTWAEKRGDPEYEKTNTFTYDEHGNPLSVIPDIGGTGNSSHFFRYDEQLRLSEYEYEFVETSAYHYTGNRKRADSATVTDIYGRIFSEVYTYDAQFRIIKSVRTMISSPFEEDNFPPETKDYVYLGDDLSSYIYGGYQQNPDVTYSDKPSIYMTNSVWKFVNQNYSKHAVAGVTSTTRIGLAHTYNETSYQFPFLDLVSPGSTITYQCE